MTDVGALDPGDDRPVLITGGAGFIGANLADRLAAGGHRVLIYDALLRPGVERNLDWLRERHGERIAVSISDVRDSGAIAEAAAQAKAVFHLAAQVAVTTSLSDPRADFEINALGTFNLLDALRLNTNGVPLVFASTNKVYGDLGDVPLREQDGRHMPADEGLRAGGIGEDYPLAFHTPYGCSKGAADQYVLDYARSYGIPAAVLRMSCIYGERQLGTEDQGWVAHFLIRALRGETITLFGDGRQVRDILNVKDAVAAYLGVVSRIDALSGKAYNLGGGPANAVSLRELLSYIQDLVGEPLSVRHEDWRQGDQRYFVADTGRLEAACGPLSATPWRTGVAELADWLRGQEIPQDSARRSAA